MDEIKNYLAHDGRVNIICAETTDLVKKAQDIHGLATVGAQTLGRMLTIGAILSSKLKSEENSMTLQIKTNGLIENVVCVVDGKLHVKGYVGNNSIVASTVEAAIGTQGFLYVIKDLGLKEPYVGIVPLKSGNISDEFEQYFDDSEQTTTFIVLGEYVEDGEIKKAGGFLVTFMPDATKQDIEEVEKLVRNADICQMFKENMSLQQIAEKMTNDDNLMVMLGKIEPKYECDCSKDRFKDAVKSLGEKDLEDIFSEQSTIETVCQFCGEKYELSKDDVKNEN